MIPRIAFTAAAALLVAVSLVACATPAPAKPTARPTASETPTPTPTVAPTPSEKPVSASRKPTCETLVSAGTVKGLTEAGWTFREKEFVIGNIPLPEGLLCFWADYEMASDHGQLFGWAELDESTSAKAQASLLADGWRREDSAEGMYITENPEFSMNVDDEGYGMTYLFGDGWVKLADTKQFLVLIEWNG